MIHIRKRVHQKVPKCLKIIIGNNSRYQIIKLTLGRRKEWMICSKEFASLLGLYKLICHRRNVIGKDNFEYQGKIELLVSQYWSSCNFFFFFLQETVNLILLYLILISTTREFYVNAVTVTTVPAGHLAELPCPSIDDQHIFMFWQLTDDKNVIGPGNPHDENKYDYEVLTGKLMIRVSLSCRIMSIREIYYVPLLLQGVSTAEAGFYKCVARGIDDASAINVHIVELVVNKEWTETQNTDYEVEIFTIDNNLRTLNIWKCKIWLCSSLQVNLITILLIIMVLVVGVAVVLFIITMKRSKPLRFDGMKFKVAP